MDYTFASTPGGFNTAWSRGISKLRPDSLWLVPSDLGPLLSPTPLPGSPPPAGRVQVLRCPVGGNASAPAPSPPPVQRAAGAAHGRTHGCCPVEEMHQSSPGSQCPPTHLPWAQPHLELQHQVVQPPPVHLQLVQLVFSLRCSLQQGCHLGFQLPVLLCALSQVPLAESPSVT